MRQLCRYAEVIKAIKQRYGNEGADTDDPEIRRKQLVSRQVSHAHCVKGARARARAHEHAKHKGQKPEAWRLRKSERIGGAGGAPCDTTCCHGRLTHGHIPHPSRPSPSPSMWSPWLPWWSRVAVDRGRRNAIPGSLSPGREMGNGKN